MPPKSASEQYGENASNIIAVTTVTVEPDTQDVCWYYTKSLLLFLLPLE